METLYDFLKQKMREKEIRIDTLIQNSDVSRATMYRIMKGMSTPGKKTVDSIIETLDLNEREIHELNLLIKRGDVDDSQRMARDALYALLYEPYEEGPVKNRELIYYSKYKYIREYDEVFGEILENLGGESAVNILILNSSQREMLAPVQYFAQEAETRNCKITIEHLLTFSLEEADRNIYILQSILPFLDFDFYQAYYRNENTVQSGPHFLENLVLVSYMDKEGKGRYMGISFVDAHFSHCVEIDEDNHAFLMKNYEYIKQTFPIPLVKLRNMNLFSDAFAKLEQGSDIFSFKENPGHHEIHPHIFRNIFEHRMDEEAKERYTQFAQDTPEKIENFDTAADLFLRHLDRRFGEESGSVFTVYTRGGLERMVETGKITGHFSILPPFTKEELIEILEDLKKRVQRVNGAYPTLIVNKEGMLRFSFIAFSKGGLFVTRFKNNKNCYLDQPKLAQIFVDFAERYVGDHAMKQDEATAFLDRLIAKCK